jgi:hypothetical protein
LLSSLLTLSVTHPPPSLQLNARGNYLYGTNILRRCTHMQARHCPNFPYRFHNPHHICPY